MPNTAVAIIGLGIMGSAFSRNLIAAGFAVRGYDPATARQEAMAADGVLIAASAAAAVQGCPIAIASLPSVAALEATVDALVAAPCRGLVVVEASTFPIEAKEAARERLAAAGMKLLDCPISGTGAQAVNRDLAIFASGDEAAHLGCRAVFAAIARVTHYVGAFGNGSRMKFIANLLVAVHNVATAEAMVLGVRSGLDADKIIDVISSGAGNSRIFELRGPMMARQNYRPTSASTHVFQKDSGIIAAFAKRLGVDTPMLDAAAPLFDEADRMGFGDDDVAAVHAVLARRAGLGRNG
ncbi:MAG TPA: NAD(P)-dependent oxidoreductase [Stellaceae bacterium]|jgi:3-hydroxyisobutyrate dehydrogenase-like beta-hydroxyacid dehydrogenase